jgi:hypothetical protein
MYVVETVSTQRYISGIFANQADAEKCLSSGGKKAQRAIRRSGVGFPFYVIEEARQVGNCFRFVNFTQITRVVEEIVRIRDEEHTYLNIYYIGGEFKPKSNGDEMGRLPRVHVNNEWLRRYDQCGSCLLAEMG